VHEAILRPGFQRRALEAVTRANGERVDPFVDAVVEEVLLPIQACLQVRGVDRAIDVSLDLRRMVSVPMADELVLSGELQAVRRMGEEAQQQLVGVRRQGVSRQCAGNILREMGGRLKSL